MLLEKFSAHPFCIVGSLLALWVIPVKADVGDALDGSVCHIYQVNPDSHSLDLLKETEYDPKSDLKQSRFTVFWDDHTQVTRVEESQNFAGLPQSLMAEFRGVDAANKQALKEGRPFEARVATLWIGIDQKPRISDDWNSVVGMFTPDTQEGSRSGKIEVNGKPVEVKLRQKNSQIVVNRSLSPAKLAQGFWKATIHGKSTDGRFVVSSMEVSQLADPRLTDDPKLPRVLVIGDSISMNYQEAATVALKGVANYHRNEGNAFSTAQGVTNMDLWLGNYREKGLQWDVIQFNHGLHDLKQSYDSATDIFGDYAVSLEDYKANLEKEIAILKQTGAKLIWCTTTPVPNDIKSTYSRRKGASKIFNDAAMEVMKRHPEILVNDLHALVDGSPVFDSWRKTVDVHFYRPEEQEMLGKAVAAAVRKALAESGPK